MWLLREWQQKKDELTIKILIHAQSSNNQQEKTLTLDTLNLTTQRQCKKGHWHIVFLHNAQKQYNDDPKLRS